VSATLAGLARRDGRDELAELVAGNGWRLSDVDKSEAPIYVWLTAAVPPDYLPGG
jgi:hypothetical protein